MTVKTKYNIGEKVYYIRDHATKMQEKIQHGYVIQISMCIYKAEKEIYYHVGDDKLCSYGSTRRFLENKLYKSKEPLQQYLINELFEGV